MAADDHGARLRHRVGDLTSDGVQETAGLAALLRALDGAILPRRVQVTRPDGAALHLRMASRRILEAECAPARWSPPGDPADLCGLLSGFAEPGMRLRMTSERRIARVDPAAPGPTPAALARRLGLDLYAPDGAPADLLAHCLPHALAWRGLGDTGGAGGDAAALAILDARLADHAGALDALRAAAGSDGPAVLVPAGFGGDNRVAIHVSGQGEHAMLLPEGGWTALAQAVAAGQAGGV